MSTDGGGDALLEMRGLRIDGFREEEWHEIPVTLDATILSDESGRGSGANFTGTFIGICSAAYSFWPY